jgi:hypothetical protein
VKGSNLHYINYVSAPRKGSDGQINQPFLPREIIPRIINAAIPTAMGLIKKIILAAESGAASRSKK